MGDINHGSDYSVGTAAFIAGALIGAGVGLLLAPQSGADTRNKLRDYAARATDDLKERGKEAKAALDNAMERGKDAYESVKEQSREGYESAKQSFRDVGKESLRNRV